MMQYCDHLETQGRVSHKDVRSVIANHLPKSLMQVSAADITRHDIINAMRTATEKGRGRTANKLRSFTHAAFQCALDVDSLASIPVAFKAFNIQQGDKLYKKPEDRIKIW